MKSINLAKLSLFVFSMALTSLVAAEDKIELLDCNTCISDSDVKVVAKSAAQSREAGVYYFGVYNTTNGLLRQARVNVQREPGLFRINAIVSTIDPSLQAAFNAWLTDYGYVDSVNKTITIDCPISERKCGNGVTTSLYEDVSSYARGHVGFYDGMIGAIAHHKSWNSKYNFFVVVNFSDGSKMKLKLISYVSSIGFVIVETLDANGNPINTGTGGSGGGTSTGTSGTIYIVGGGSGGGGGWIRTVVCVRGGTCTVHMVRK